MRRCEGIFTGSRKRRGARKATDRGTKADARASQPKRKAGRPKAPIDLAQLEKLCELQCTYEEIAAYFRVSLSTVEKLVATDDVKAIVERGRNVGKISIRRQQLQLLKKGNATMAVWLGKQFLGQRDKLDTMLKTPPEDPLKIQAEVHVREQAIRLQELFTPDQIAEAHQRLREREMQQVAAQSGPAPGAAA